MAEPARHFCTTIDMPVSPFTLCSNGSCKGCDEASRDSLKWALEDFGDLAGRAATLTADEFNEHLSRLLAMVGFTNYSPFMKAFFFGTVLGVFIQTGTLPVLSNDRLFRIIDGFVYNMAIYLTTIYDGPDLSARSRTSILLDLLIEMFDGMSESRPAALSHYRDDLIDVFRQFRGHGVETTQRADLSRLIAATRLL